jgi:prevent-host-death family protein
MAKTLTDLKEISALAVRQRLGEILSRVANQRDRFVIKKAGIPTAVLFSIQDYEDLNDLVQTALEQLDPEYQKSLKQARKEIEAGRYIRDEDMWRDLIKKEAKARGQVAKMVR